MTVEWLIQKLESDQDPHKFASADDLLIDGPKDESMMNPPRKRREQRRQDVPRDRHRRTKDGRDRRVRVPYNCVSRLTDITQKIAGKSDGKTIEWLYKKYWLSRIRPQQAIPSTTTINSNFNGAYLSPDDDSLIFATRLSIPSHNSQQNPAGRYEQDVFVEPTFNADPNSAQYEIAPSSHPWDFYIGDSANQLQHISYPQQQTFIQPNPSNFQSWMPNASKPNSTGFTSITQPCYPRNQWSVPDEAVMAGERLVRPPEDLSYYEQVWNPESTSFTSIPQSEPMIP